MTARIATGNPDDALDLVQEAMMQLVRRYAGHDAQEWGALFHRILQNRIQDWRRRTRVRNRWRAWFDARDEDEAADPVAAIAVSGGPGPQEQAASTGAMAALEAALRTLPARQQQAFLLRAWEGLDVEQTARAMGCAAGSVKTHYSRALHALRELLEDHWGD